MNQNQFKKFNYNKTFYNKKTIKVNKNCLLKIYLFLYDHRTNKS